MLINHNEYQLMFDAEERLWWYQILHKKVERAIQEHFNNNKAIAILDAGCGTGGLLSFLQKKGYKNSIGFDYSESAVGFSQQRGLNVSRLSIDDILELSPNQSFDVIISNDVIYALEESQIQNTFINIEKRLKPNGVFITNNNAFRAFRGTHDIAVGSKHRFTLTDIKKYATPTPLVLIHNTYWSFFLAPLILGVRLLQQFQLRFGLINTSELVSDVSVPPPFVNKMLYSIMQLEEKLLKKAPFGSSLFTVFKKSV